MSNVRVCCVSMHKHTTTTRYQTTTSARCAYGRCKILRVPYTLEYACLDTGGPVPRSPDLREDVCGCRKSMIGFEDCVVEDVTSGCRATPHESRYMRQNSGEEGADRRKQFLPTFHVRRRRDWSMIEVGACSTRHVCP